MFWIVLLALVARPLVAAPDSLAACRLLGKASYENDDFKTAAEEFRRCIALAPRSAPDHFNLGLVLLRAADYTNALAALDRAEQLDPGLKAAGYVRGILHKRRGKFPEAIASLKRVITADPACIGAYYNLAVCYKSSEQYTNAITTLLAAIECEPNNPNCHYQLVTLYRRIGNVESASRHAEIYDRIKDTLDESEKTVEALERSRYSYIIEVPSVGGDTSAMSEMPVRFVDVTREAGLAAAVRVAPRPPAASRKVRREDFSPELIRRHIAGLAGSVALGDYDGDGRLDIYLVSGSTNEQDAPNRLFHNDGKGCFSDVTAKASVGGRGLGTHAVWGDFDNDKLLDLYVVNHGPNILYRNRGDGTFEDISEKAHANEPQSGSRAAFVDYDHDNDLDLLIANNADLSTPPERDPLVLPDDFPGQVNALLRNNGNGTFTDQTDEAGLLVDASQSREVICADFDGDTDTDLFVANYDAPSRLFLNVRMGKFAQGGSFDPPLAKGVTAAAEADFNRDGYPDLVVAVRTNLLLYTNDDRANFVVAADLKGFIRPPTSGESLLDEAATPRIHILDFNNDAWPDVLFADASRLHLFAGSGKGRFRDATAESGLSTITGDIADLASGDLDKDGDLDLVLQTRDRGPLVLRNTSTNASHWLAVRLSGKKVNRCGYGAAIEIAAAGHYQKRTVTADIVHFGLGALTHIEVVRVTWPNGMAQNVIQPAIDRVLDIEEYVKVSASCAFLWADGGQGFQLINEVLGIGPLGVPMSVDKFFPVDCTELTKIEPHQLAARNGHYELRLTEDLRELAYVDQVELRVVDHPDELEIIPNEMFTGPPFPEDRFFAVREHRVPRSAVDDQGHDVLDLIRRRDGRFPTFPLTAHDGLAHPHSLTLDLGDLSGTEQILLFLDGWIYWPDSSVSWGIFQNPALEITPLKLEVRDAQGCWQTAIESVGLPTSKGLVVPVDLAGKFPGPDAQVRLSTTMCVYFDRIFVSTRDAAALCRVTSLPARGADLHYCGFHKMNRDELGYERFDYREVNPFGPWNPPRGLLTRYGDVTSLLARPDDMFVIIAPGDEMTMRFNARDLPALPQGWVRSFIFYANGWVKDGDPNTRCSETIEPLPFHGMSAYPYSLPEHYPDHPEHREYLRTYQIRPSRPTVGDLTKIQPTLPPSIRGSH